MVASWSWWRVVAPLVEWIRGVVTSHWIVGQWLLQWLEHLSDLDVLNLGQMLSIVGQSMAVKCWLVVPGWFQRLQIPNEFFLKVTGNMALLG